MQSKGIFLRDSLLTAANDSMTGTKFISHLLKSCLSVLEQKDRAWLEDIMRYSEVFYLFRKDKVLQALSQDRARCTRVFHARDLKNKKIAQKKSWDYNYERILESFDGLNRQEMWLSAYMDNLGIRPFILDYSEDGENEDNWRKCLSKKVSKNEPSEPNDKMPLTLRDDRSREYAERFVAEYRKLNGRDPVGYVPPLTD